MYVAIVKIAFDPSSSLTGQDKKALHSISHKIKERFNCSVLTHSTIEQEGESIIALAILDHQKNQLSQKIDAIIDLCENSGIGRVAREDSVFEDLDGLIAELNE